MEKEWWYWQNPWTDTAKPRSPDGAIAHVSEKLVGAPGSAAKNVLFHLHFELTMQKLDVYSENAWTTSRLAIIRALPKRPKCSRMTGLNADTTEV